MDPAPTFEMPSYDFQCQECETVFERRLSMSEYDRGEGRECPECGSARVERRFSAVGVITGSGSAGGTGSSAGGSGGVCHGDGFT